MCWQGFGFGGVAWGHVECDGTQAWIPRGARPGMVRQEMLGTPKLRTKQASGQAGKGARKRTRHGIGQRRSDSRNGSIVGSSRASFGDSGAYSSRGSNDRQQHDQGQQHKQEPRKRRQDR